MWVVLTFLNTSIILKFHIQLLFIWQTAVKFTLSHLTWMYDIRIWTFVSPAFVSLYFIQYCPHLLCYLWMISRTCIMYICTMIKSRYTKYLDVNFLQESLVCFYFLKTVEVLDKLWHQIPKRKYFPFYVIASLLVERRKSFERSSPNCATWKLWS